MTGRPSPTTSTSISPDRHRPGEAETISSVLEDIDATGPSGRFPTAGKPLNHDAAVPEPCFARHRVAPVEKYPDELRSALRSLAPLSASAESDRALMTPRLHSAYYEHSFLADKLGIELVEVRDLIVRQR